MVKPTFTHHYPLKYVIMWVLFVAATVLAVVIIMGTANASDKYDGDCTGNETVGRCADKPACQYPFRSTNPPGGCDNSDPCDPADAAKGGSGACTPTSQSQVEPMSQNNKTVENTVERVHNSCVQ